MNTSPERVEHRPDTTWDIAPARHAEIAEIERLFLKLHMYNANLDPRFALAEDWGTIKGEIVWAGGAIPPRAKVDVTKDKEHCLAKGPLLSDELLIDVKTNAVEHPRLVADRLVRLGRIIGSERVIAGTDCGFDTFIRFSLVDPKVAWLKLRALADGAELASAQV